MNQSEQFSPNSKVWVYQSSRPFTDAEIVAINQQLKTFSAEWTAHNLQLHAGGFVYEDRIIVLMVDESKNEASGCSIDKSVHFLKALESQYQINLFDRMLVTYMDHDKLSTTTLHELDQLEATQLVIDPLVRTKMEFDERFVLPLKDSWMMQYHS